MKLIACRDTKCSCGNGIAKALLLMKMTMILLLAFCLNVSAKGFSQNVTLVERDASLEKVFKEIKTQTGKSFVFTGKQLKMAGKISITVYNEPLETVLPKILRGKPLTFSFQDDVITIKEVEDVSITQTSEAAAPPITGKVFDENGKPLAGASVKLKGTDMGTTTDDRGRFLLQNPKEGDRLIISYVGYESAEILVSKSTDLKIVLKPLETKASEVVVVGYGTQKKVNLTGAIATATGTELNKRVVTNPASLLQGKLPGLQVVQNSGEPGNEGISLLVRGQGTFSGAGNSPLVIINGLPGDITSLDPNNIESATVLKDAASAAIYGSRAANGVILVTTKNGQSGRMSLEYGYNLGITTPTALPKLITNSVEFMQLYNEARKNSGLNELYSQDIIDQYKNATDKTLFPNTDWQSIMFSKAYVQNHYLNLSGGNNGTNYNVALGIVDQPGTMRGIAYKKYNLQFDLTSAINKNVKFGTSITMNYGDRTGAQISTEDQYLSTLAQAPTYGPMLPDGSGRYTYKAYAFENNNKNPVQMADQAPLKQKSYYLLSNLFLNIKLLDGLQWETRGGVNFSLNNNKVFTPTMPRYFWGTGELYPASVTGNSLNVTDNQSVYPMIYSQLTYNKTLGNHNFTVLGGAQEEYFKNTTLSAGRLNFPSNDVKEINAGSTNGQSTAGTTYEWSIRSYYGRLNYDFKGKYLLEANARYDGSSRFAPENRWGLFPSVSAGWRFTKEEFLNNKISWLNDGKLRASWGRLGNQNIGGAYPYPYQNILSPSGYPFDGNTVSPGIQQTRLVDKDITWETTEIANLGIDLSFFKRRLNISADWFEKNTFNILRSAQIPTYIGLSAPTVNDGKMRNTGFEVQAQFSDHIGKVSYSIGGNIQAYKNKLTGFGAKEIDSRTILQEGLPYNSFYLYQWDGIFQSQDEIKNSATQPVTPHPGDLKFRDVNGDGVIDEKDRVYTKGAFPDYTYSFNLNAGWNNFDFTAFFFGSEGQKTYATDWGIEPFAQGSVPSVDWRNRWTPDHHTNSMPNIYVWGAYPAVSSYASTYYLHDASFLRLKNLQIGYNVPKSFTQKLHMQSLRFYFSGDNLITFSKYPGLDPERVSNSGRYVVYPQNKIYSFGIRAKF
jgi:TonB-linked SusC/RagA family outer membrane protein